MKRELRQIEDLPLSLTTEEGACALGVGLTTMKAAVREGQIRSFKFRNTRRIPRSEIERLLSSETAVR